MPALSLDLTIWFASPWRYCALCLCIVHRVQLLPVLGSGHSAGLVSGQLATTAAGGTSSGTAGAVLPVQSLGGAGRTAFILAPNVYMDQELAVLANG